MTTENKCFDTKNRKCVHSPEQVQLCPETKAFGLQHTDNAVTWTTIHLGQSQVCPKATHSNPHVLERVNIHDIKGTLVSAHPCLQHTRGAGRHESPEYGVYRFAQTCCKCLVLPSEQCTTLPMIVGDPKWNQACKHICSPTNGGKLGNMTSTHDSIVMIG